MRKIIRIRALGETEKRKHRNGSEWQLNRQQKKRQSPNELDVVIAKKVGGGRVPTTTPHPREEIVDNCDILTTNLAVLSPTRGVKYTCVVNGRNSPTPLVSRANLSVLLIDIFSATVRSTPIRAMGDGLCVLHAPLYIAAVSMLGKHLPWWR